MQVEHAISDGYDVRSFLYWTLVDNFEVRSCSHQQQTSPFLPCRYVVHACHGAPRPELDWLQLPPAQHCKTGCLNLITAAALRFGLQQVLSSIP